MRDSGRDRDEDYDGKSRRSKRMKDNRRYEEKSNFEKTPKGERRNRPRRRFKMFSASADDYYDYYEEDELEET